MSPGSGQRAARIVAGLAAAFWVVLWFGLIDFLVVIEQDAQFAQDYVLESGWGLLYLVLVGVPLVVLAVHPGEPAALAHVGVVTAAVLIGAAWRGTWPQTWNGLGLLVTLAVLVWLGGWRRVRVERPDPWLGALALVGLVAAVAYGAPLIGNTTAPEDITNGVSHYPMQASMALAVALSVALASVTRARLPAWTAAFSAAWLGAESVAYPQLRASLGSVGGAVAIAWAVLVVAAVEAARRRVR